MVINMKKIIPFLLCILLSNIWAQKPYDLVDITKINPDIHLDLRYATDNNFLGKTVYPQARCFLRYAAAVRLDSIQNELEQIGLGLKIFDGFRPLEIQRQMWEVMPDARYVANPYKGGSRHNRGVAVDLSLVDSRGNELEMPTDFDDFSEKAHHAQQNLPAIQKRNRWILLHIMEKYGFKPITSEWWHYDLKNWRQFKIIDVPLEELYKVDQYYPLDQ